jgi:translation initiation factor eIF-2B subunit delta
MSEPSNPVTEAVATPTTPAQPAPATAAPTTNGAAPAPKADSSEQKKLSPAELKKQKQAEKQAKRAQAKAAGGPSGQQSGPSKDNKKQQKDSKQPAKDDKSKPMPIRRRPSQSHVQPVKEPEKKSKKEPKQDSFLFGHLYNQPKQQSLVGASKDVHPAILSLGLQYSSYAICGSTARMLSMLLAFKSFISSYTTPPEHSLARHLTTHGLSPQIEFLKSCRPLSTSMGNAIRWLKDGMSQCLKPIPLTTNLYRSDHQGRPYCA